MNPITIVGLMDTLFARWFSGPSWTPWRVLLKAVFALPLDDAELAIFRAATGRSRPPANPCRECWCLVGRRGGKTIIAAALAVYFAFFKDFSPFVVVGEIVTIQLVAADRKQSRTLLRYVMGFIRGLPMLAERLVRVTREGVEIAGIGGVQVVIEITTASKIATRSYTLVFVANDETAFWPVSEYAAQPDVEILTAQRPGLSTIPCSLMWCASTAFARKGALHAAFEAHYGRDDDPVLFWRAPSRSLALDAPVEMNSLIDREVVRAAYETDSVAASAEWNADFRSDVEKVFTAEMLAAVTDFDRPLILPPDHEEVA